jgi:hypothetical protein
MFLADYLSKLEKVIHEYTKTNLIISSEIKSDFRTDKIGVLKGDIAFADGSRLSFMEYLDVRYKVEKLTYSFHYQQMGGKLIFRYDNAKHKPKLDFTSHKHLFNGKVAKSEVPDLKDVLEE